MQIVDDDPVAALGGTKLVPELGRTARPLFHGAGHRLFHGVADVVGDIGVAQVRDGLRGDPQELGDHLLAAVPLERGMSG